MVVDSPGYVAPFVVGIDPGLNGWAAIVGARFVVQPGETVSAVMPVGLGVHSWRPLPVKETEFGLRTVDAQTLVRWVHRASGGEARIAEVVIEAPIAVPRSEGEDRATSLHTASSIHFGVGAMAGAFECAGFPVRFVRPQQWKRALNIKSKAGVVEAIDCIVLDPLPDVGSQEGRIGLCEAIAIALSSSLFAPFVSSYRQRFAESSSQERKH